LAHENLHLVAIGFVIGAGEIDGGQKKEEAQDPACASEFHGLNMFDTHNLDFPKIAKDSANFGLRLI
jgi:hypothetical protein